MTERIPKAGDRVRVAQWPGVVAEARRRLDGSGWDIRFRADNPRISLRWFSSLWRFDDERVER